MADFRVYRTYSYIDKNPVIDRVRTILQDEGVFTRLGIVHELSGVSASTLYNWFHGDTRNPQHHTTAAVITSLGYSEQYVKGKEIDIEKELEIARVWLAKQPKRKRKARAKKR
jgi:hypothetical protein